MNRKQKIIISITGIILVSLILIGLTYAYFLTKITGNTNSKSISVTTANLVLKYGEETQDIITKEALMPGETAAVKVFSATNEGNSDVTYGAALENIVNGLSRQEDLVYTLTCTSYLKSGFSLSSDGTITGTVDGTCNGVSTEKQFPSTSTLSVMVTNTIDTTHTQAYKLTITYKEMNVDQSTDMNKTFSAKVNIVDINALTVNNPYKNDTGTLKKTIIDNAMLGIGTTQYSDTPKTTPGNETSYETTELYNEKMVISDTSIYSELSTWKIGDTEESAKNGTKINSYEEAIGKYVYSKRFSWTKKMVDYNTKTGVAIFDNKVNTTYELTLSKTVDDYGISYYYRGNVTDNYINFAGMCWRIIRIDGNGNTKLLLEDKTNTCENMIENDWSIGKGTYGSTKYAKGTLTDSSGNTNTYASTVANYIGGTDQSMANSMLDFQTNKLNNFLSKLEIGDWCYDETSYVNNVLSNRIDSIVGNKNITYGAGYRLDGTTKNPTLKCNGTKLTKFNDTNNTNMYVGPINADEAVFSGLSLSNISYSYMNLDYIKRFNGIYFYTISLKNHYALGNDSIYTINYLSNNYSSSPDESKDYRPSILLKNNVTISKGNGTMINPYVVE